MTLEERVAELERIVAQLQHRAKSSDRMRGINHERRVDPVLIGGGEELRRARKVVGWVGDGLAGALTVRKETVSRWERNAVAIPRWRAQQIVECFRINGHEPPRWPLEGWTLPVDLYMTDGE